MPVDDLTHYMEATGRMRVRAEQAEARVADLEATVGYALDELEQIDTHHRTLLDRTRAFHARGALRRALKGDGAK